jgi:nitroreductase
MDTMECIKARRSIRKFKPEPISKEVLTEIIQVAQWSPSYKNSQPWEAIVLSGAKKEALTKMLLQLVEKDEAPCPDLPAPGAWPAAEAARIDRLMSRRAKAMGVGLNDLNALKQAKKANFSFYGAPHEIYLFQDASLPLWSLFDMGLFAQTLMLAAREKGLGTVPQAFATDYAQHIKEFLGIPKTKRLVLGIAIGYADMQAPENALRSDRGALDELVKWME